MKKNTLQKVLSVALVGAMTATMFVGCGNSSTDTTADTSADATADAPAAEPAADVVAGIDGFEPFAENVTIQIPVYDRGDSSNGVSDVVNNYWTKWIQTNFGDKYNVTVEYVGITRSDVMTDYSLLAASGELPTICMEYDYDKLATWASDGYLQEYDLEELKTVAPTYYQQMVDTGIDAYTEVADGNYLVLGARDYGFSNYTFATFYRLDWVKEAGYDTLPNNTTELIKCYEKIAEKHPQFLSGSKVAGAGVDQNYGYRDYPQDEETWATTGDYQIPALSTEAQKRFLKLQNYYYNQGWINPEYQTRDASEAEADFVNGTAMYYSGYISTQMDKLTALYENEPTAELGVQVCSGKYEQDATWGTSQAYRAGSPIGAMFGFSNNATEDQIKAVMMYIEWMIQDENLFTLQWGEEGKNFEYVDGAPTMLAEQPDAENGQMGHNTNVDYWMIVQAVKTFGTIEDTIKSVSPVGLPQDFSADLIANFNGQKAMYEAGNANIDCMFGAALDSVTEYGTTLKEEVYPRLRDQLVTCKPDEFDALYEKCSEEYLAAGYQDVIDERLELFNAGMTSRLQ